jgi:hypothetical protein
MLDNLKLYKVLTYILIPIAFIFGFIDAISLLISFLNPSGLLEVFIMGCFVVYIFTSFRFFKQGIQAGKHFKKSFKDLINVNAFVSLFFCITICLKFVSKLFNNFNEELALLNSMSQKPPPGYTQEAFNNLTLSVMKGAFTFLFITAIICLIHILMTFRLLKKNAELFETK